MLSRWARTTCFSFLDALWLIVVPFALLNVFRTTIVVLLFIDAFTARGCMTLLPSFAILITCLIQTLSINEASEIRFGSQFAIPSMSEYISTNSAFIAEPKATALVSLPPRPRVRMSPSEVLP